VSWCNEEWKALHVCADSITDKRSKLVLELVANALNVVIFAEAVRNIIPLNKYEVQWNKKGTRIRVIILNFEDNDKQRVLEKLNDSSEI
jgi:hypothetical protein